jgi:hypothetical protein
MQTSTTHRNFVTEPDVSPTPTNSHHASDLHTRLSSLFAHASILASLTTPEAVIALAYGVPRLDTETMAQLLDESRRFGFPRGPEVGDANRGQAADDDVRDDVPTKRPVQNHASRAAA